jgi:putative AbiEi antitoxin of type IV toxin-antitoxin system
MYVETQTRILAALDANAGLLTPGLAEPLGISRVTLRRAADAGILLRRSRGVYTRPEDTVPAAALVAAGLPDPAVLSHRGAAANYELDGVAPGCLEWSIPHTRRTSMPGVHQRRRFKDLDVVERNGLLVTSLPQTLGDLGAVVGVDIVERAVESALRRALTTEEELHAFAAHRHCHRQGGPTLRAALARRPRGAKPTGSDVETICLQVYRAGGVPNPTRQFEIWDGDLFVGAVDFHFWPVRFGTEVDGLDSHGSQNAFQYDLNRANRIGDMGHLLRRFTYWDVVRRPTYVCRETLRGLQLATSA